jgi:hypothetical protein
VDGFSHRRTTALAAWVGLLATALLGACASAADVQARQDAAWAAVESDADGLFAALEAVAAQRALPIDRRDAQRRRLTSFWMAEGESSEVRRRYFLAVILHPEGLALHARIAREQRLRGEHGDEVWSALEPTEAVTAEQQAIIEEAYARWADRH